MLIRIGSENSTLSMINTTLLMIVRHRMIVREDAPIDFLYKCDLRYHTIYSHTTASSHEIFALLLLCPYSTKPD